MLATRIACVSTACLLAVSSASEDIGERVQNFRLLDQFGASHELYYFSDSKAVVIMAYSAECPALSGHLRRLKSLVDSYAEAGVRFFLLRSSGSREATLDDADAMLAGAPMLMDDTGTLASSMGLNSAGDVVILNPRTWRTAYVGNIGVQHVLREMIAGNATMSVHGPPSDTGCEMDLIEPPSVSYATDVAPILIRKCLSCHRRGGIAPWAMTNYTMVRGFAPMMGEVIRTHRMPPWHADPSYGIFRNDRSLSIHEKRFLLRWIALGAPRDGEHDPLVGAFPKQHNWLLGVPDLVIDIPPFEVPASGVVHYRYPSVENPIEGDAWVRALEIRPGDSTALHHVLVSVTTSSLGGGVAGLGGLGGYAPGDPVLEFPEETGLFLPSRSRIVFQMHYTPYGKPTVDRSRIGLFLHDRVPRHRVRIAALFNSRIRVPAHAKEHCDSASRTFRRDIVLFSLLPHAHYRGKSSRFEAMYENGSSEVLLSVPNFDFNWQTNYTFAVPKRIAGGTTIVHTTCWDNSAQKAGNPDPDREVFWGNSSWDEMLIGWVTYRYSDA